MPARIDFWTEENVEKLIDYWVNRRMAGTRIGELLGCSRNMVVGKVWRLKLKGGTPQDKRPKPVWAGPKATRVRGPRKPRPSRAKQPPRTPDIILPPNQKHRVTLMGLRNWSPSQLATCRFPTWQTPRDQWTPIPEPDQAFYCGGPVPSSTSSYCQWHSQVAYETASARIARIKQEKMEPVIHARVWK